jgi:cytochrome c-type biogenesis protein CcsB
MKALIGISFSLFLLLIIILGITTFIEKEKGSDFVFTHIYHSWWFILSWMILFLTAVGVLIGKAVYKKRPVFLLHISFGIILFGAFFSYITSEKGYLHLREGAGTAEFLSEDQTGLKPLPFEIVLDKFEIEYYPGTQSPADYISYVSINSQAEKSQFRISMNNILSYEGYRFYQASFDEDRKGSILSVNYDPLGTPVTYTGYILLFVSMIWFLISKDSTFRKLLASPLFKQIGCILLMIFMTEGLGAQPSSLTRSEAARFGELQMLYEDRIVPVQTFARDFTIKLYGKKSYGDFTAEQVLAGWIFFPQEWQYEPMIKINDKNVAHILGNGDMVRFIDYFLPDGTYKLSEYQSGINKTEDAKKLKSINEANEKAQLITMLQSGEILKIFPLITEDNLEWVSPVSLLPTIAYTDSVFIRGILPLMYQELLKEKRELEIESLIGKIEAFQQKNAGNNLLSPGKIKAELWYNKSDVNNLLFKLNLTFGVLALIYFCWSVIKSKRKRWIEMLFIVQLIHSFAFLTLNLVLRWYISGHIPLSNGYETMMFIAWCVLFLTFILRKRFFLITASGFIISGFALLVSSLGAMNPQITSLMPVLASPWLSVHVSLIMISYSLFAFITLNATISLLLFLTGNVNSPKIRTYVENFKEVSRLLLFPAVFLLTAGIFVGAVWANVSWGRYWGWDPKEVWALITMMIYSLAFHTKRISWFNNPVFFHSFSIIAFYSVLMTYFGVNYLLGGMHSYGNTGNLSGFLFLGLLPLILVIISCIKYLRIKKLVDE